MSNSFSHETILIGYVNFQKQYMYYYYYVVIMPFPILLSSFSPHMQEKGMELGKEEVVILNRLVGKDLIKKMPCV